MSKYKYGLILDTNIFFNLSKQDCYKDYIYQTFFSNDMFLNPDILFIIPEQIQTEWKRLINEKEARLLEDQKRPLIKALQLTKHLDDDKQEDSIKEALNQAIKIQERIHKYVVKKRIGIINDILFGDEDFVNRPRITVKRSSEIENLLVNLSLNHSAPFFGDDNGKGNTNEMADAIIFFSACEFAKKNPELCESYFFITEDKNFSNGPKLHKNIHGYANEANLKFHCSLKTFVDSEFKETSEKYKGTEETLFLNDKYFKICSECKQEVHINNGNYKDTPQDEYWYYQCECGHEWTEFETRPIVEDYEEKELN